MRKEQLKKGTRYRRRHLKEVARTLDYAYIQQGIEEDYVGKIISIEEQWCWLEYIGYDVSNDSFETAQEYAQDAISMIYSYIARLGGRL